MFFSPHTRALKRSALAINSLSSLYCSQAVLQGNNVRCFRNLMVLLKDPFYRSSSLDQTSEFYTGSYRIMVVFKEFLLKGLCVLCWYKRGK